MAKCSKFVVISLALVTAASCGKDKKKATGIELKINGEIALPLPGLMKMVVAPVVESEFEKLVDKYIANLIKEFGGEA